MKYLPNDDPEVAQIIQREEARIENTLDLIAAENHAPRSILEAQGSIFSTKAAEGYPGRRFHAGCVYADELESLAIKRASGCSMPIMPIFNPTAGFRPTWRFISRFSMSVTESFR